MQYFWQFSNNVPFLVPLTTTGLGLDFTLLDTIGIFLGGSLTMEGNVVVLTSMTGPEVISGFAASISYWQQRCSGLLAQLIINLWQIRGRLLPTTGAEVLVVLLLFKGLITMKKILANNTVFGKSQKKSHSTLRAKRATFTLKLPKTAACSQTVLPDRSV